MWADTIALFYTNVKKEIAIIHTYIINFRIIKTEHSKESLQQINIFKYMYNIYLYIYVCEIYIRKLTYMKQKLTSEGDMNTMQEKN